MKEVIDDHAFVHDNLAAYLAEGLGAAERGRFDDHINNCPECFDAFSEARDADRELQRTLGTLKAGAGLEEGIISHVREHSMNHHPFLRRAAYATAAAVALAATGLFANIAMRQDGRFSNPLTRSLVAQADTAVPELGRPADWVAGKVRMGREVVPVPAAVMQERLANPKRGEDTSGTSIDNQKDGKTIIEYRQLTNTNATEASKLINSVFSPPTASGGSGGAGVNPTSNLKVDVDARTNTVVINGPANKVAQAIDMLNRIESIPVDKLSTSTYARQDDRKTVVDRSTAGLDLGVRDDWSEIERKKAMASAFDLVGQAGGQQFLAKSDPPGSQGAAGAYDLYTKSYYNQLEKADKPVMPPQGVGFTYLYRNGGDNGKALSTSTNGDDIGFEFGHGSSLRNQTDVNGNALKSDRSSTVAVSGAIPGFRYAPKAGEGENNSGKLTISGGGGIINEGVGYAGGTTKAEAGGITKTGSGVLNFSGGTITGGNTLANGTLRGEGQIVAMGDGHAEWSRGLEDKTDESYKLTDQAGKTGFSEALVEHETYLTQPGAPVVNQSRTTKDSRRQNVDALVADAGKLYDAQQLKESADLLKKATIIDPQDENAALALRLVQNKLAAREYDLIPKRSGTEDSLNSAKTGEHLIPYADLLVSTDKWPEITQNAFRADYGWDFTYDRKTTNQPTGTTVTGPVNGDGTRTSDVKSMYEFTNGRWWNINDLDKFYDATAKAPSFDLLAMASSPEGKNLVAAVTPITPPITSTAGGTTTAPATRPAQAPIINALKIIRSGTIDFEVASFDATYRTVARLVAEDGGFVASTSSEKLANGHVRGTIVVRVPPGENLEHFLSGLRGLGELKSQQLGAADVTKQFYDIDSELRALTTMETSLLELAKNPTAQVKDLSEVYKQLGDIRVRMEKLKGEISYYNNLVALATITITAFEKDIASPTAAFEQENVVANIQTEEVEAKYQAARKIFEDAKGRIVESQLKNTDADHIAAHIVAEIPPDKSDFVANQLKQLGVVASFNRDRRQTTTGGTGAPGVQVEQKNTRFTVELFNLANLNPRETTVLTIAVRDVEGVYKTLLSTIKQQSNVQPPAPATTAPAADPALRLSGRVTSSNLNGQIPEQMSATISAELRALDADAILSVIRASGEVITSQLNTNPDNANTTSAKRGLQITLKNIASINPKEGDGFKIAVNDVDGAYKAMLALIRKEAPAGAGPGAALLTPTMGRVLSSNQTGQLVEASASINAEIRADQAEAVLAALRATGEVLTANSNENPDAVNYTRLKRGLAVQFVNAASVSARETRDLRARADNVADSYKKLLDALSGLTAKGDVRIIKSALSDADPRNANAGIDFEARRSVLGDVERAFTAAGIEFPVTIVNRSTDNTNTLDSKVHFVINSFLPAETMAPKKTITMGLEVQNVDAAVAQLRSTVSKLGNNVRESDFSITRDSAGHTTANITLDCRVSTTPIVLADINNLNGTPLSTQEVRDPQAPETKTFTKECIKLTLNGRLSIITPDQGLGQSTRAALTSAAGALFLALYYILTGLLFIAPFVIIGWPVWKLIKRRKAAKATT